MIGTRLNYWHVNHDKVFGTLIFYDGRIAKRRWVIRKEKPKHEIALRLRLLKRVKNQKELREIMEHDYRIGYWQGRLKILHKKECIPNCPWNWELSQIVFPRLKERKKPSFYVHIPGQGRKKKVRFRKKKW